MYVIESYQDLNWVYKVVDEGLKPVAGGDYIWTWDSIYSDYNNFIPNKHVWTVISDEDMFLETL